MLFKKTEVGRLNRVSLKDSEGNEISIANIDNELPFALKSDLSIAIVANWVNTSLKAVGCGECVGTHDVARMIDTSSFDGRGTYSMTIPNHISFQIN